MVQGHIYYSGIVQGVGFRYTVNQYAHELNLVGWVRNLPDGRVEILVEGSKKKICQFCSNIEEYFVSKIDNKDINFYEPNGNFQSFRVAF